MDVLTSTRWVAAARAHEAAVDERVAGHLARRQRGEAHPVEDFVFTYYRLRPAALRRWSPGLGTGLEVVDAPPAEVVERAARRWYHVVDDVLQVDLAAYLTDRAGAVRFVRDLLRATASRPPQLGCFGLHEWAMVYRVPEGAQRHEDHPLRLGTAGTDRVVEEHRIRCSHHDAFRFFTPDAVPLNPLQPTRSGRIDQEQPGCLHATMDLYKWAGQLGPVVPSGLLLKCFDLARDVRELDMQASPYDLADLGYPPVRIETPDGKAEYARRQRGFAERAAPLREALVDVCEVVLDQDASSGRDSTTRGQRSGPRAVPAARITSATSPSSPARARRGRPPGR